MPKSKQLENYAKLSLEYLFPHFKDCFKLADKPDLQNENDNIGIEVTSSAPTVFMQNERFGEDLLGLEIDSSNKDKILSFNGKVTIIDGKVFAIQAFTVDAPNHFERNYVKEIEGILKVKSQKEKFYKHFKSNGLYIFTYTSLIDKNELNKICKLISIYYFDFVILNCIDSIYLIKDTVYTKYELTDTELKYIACKSFRNY